jgi:hypothetical protein
MDDSTAAVANRPIVPIFFVTLPDILLKKIETMVSHPSLRSPHPPRDEPHNPTGSWESLHR